MPNPTFPNASPSIVVVPDGTWSDHERSYCRLSLVISPHTALDGPLLNLGQWPSEVAKLLANLSLQFGGGQNAIPLPNLTFQPRNLLSKLSSQSPQDVWAHVFTQEELKLLWQALNDQQKRVQASNSGKSKLRQVIPDLVSHAAKQLHEHRMNDEVLLLNKYYAAFKKSNLITRVEEQPSSFAIRESALDLRAPASPAAFLKNKADVAKWLAEKEGISRLPLLRLGKEDAYQLSFAFLESASQILGEMIAHAADLQEFSKSKGSLLTRVLSRDPRAAVELDALSFPADRSPLPTELKKLAIVSHMVHSVLPAQQPPPPDDKLKAQLRKLNGIRAFSRLARVLGMVVDIDIPANEIPSGEEHQFVWVTTTNGDGAIRESPKTAFSYVPDSFFGPRPMPCASGEASNYISGFLNLGSKRYALTTRNDRAIFEAARQATDQARTEKGMGEPEERIDYGESKQHTIGIQILDGQQHEDVNKEIGRACWHSEALAESDVPPDAQYAEDLVEGVRFDVGFRKFSHEPYRWCTLSGRQIQFLKEIEEFFEKSHYNAPSHKDLDDGDIRIGVKLIEKPKKPAQIDEEALQNRRDVQELAVAHGVLATWTGWSLALPTKSSKTDLEELDLRVPAILTHPDDELRSFDGKKVSIHLPPLRFGYQYCFAARLRYRNGGGIPWRSVANSYPDLRSHDGGNRLEPDGFRFLRREPVDPPVVHLSENPRLFPDSKPRSGKGQPVNTLGEHAECIVVRTGEGEESGKNTARILVAPRIGKDLAILHGVFDRIDEPKSAFPYFQLCGETGDFPAWNHPECNRHRDSRVKPEQDERPLATDTIARPNPKRIAAPKIPHFPDPLARIMQLTVVLSDGSRPARVRVPLYDDDEYLPEKVKSVYVRLKSEAAQEASIQVNDKDLPGGIGSVSDHIVVVDIVLPAGVEAELAMQCLPERQDWEILSAFDELKGQVDRIAGAELASALRWLVERPFTPPLRSLFPEHRIRLVHASQFPVLPPTLTVDRLDRKQGESAAGFHGKIALSAASTGKVRLVLQWEDWGDKSTIRFSDGEYQFKPVVASTSVELTDISSIENKLPLGSDRRNLTLDFFDTKRRDLTIVPWAVSRFTTYFQPGKEHCRAGEHVCYILPASARPQPPKIDWIIPAFDTATEAQQHGLSITRLARTRIYLKEFFQSGPGERLAVVCGPAKPAGVDPKLHTRWASDPTQAPRVGRQLESGDFTGGEASCQAMLYGQTGALGIVWIVSYKPQFEKATGRWYCDVGIRATGAYTPFVNFGLARYQEHALHNDEDLRLSLLADMEWINLVANRSIHVTREPAWQGVTKVHLTYEGDAAWESGTQVIFTRQHASSGAPIVKKWCCADGAPIRCECEFTVPTAELTAACPILVEEFEVRRAKGAGEREGARRLVSSMLVDVGETA